ncbi:hypothetical protein Lal_00043757 [Lupinus albus]|nr:hypothetical protein Lal_00043757 [Lupinus albus]
MNSSRWRQLQFLIAPRRNRSFSTPAAATESCNRSNPLSLYYLCLLVFSLLATYASLNAHYWLISVTVYCGILLIEQLLICDVRFAEVDVNYPLYCKWLMVVVIEIVQGAYGNPVDIKIIEALHREIGQTVMVNVKKVPANAKAPVTQGWAKTNFFFGNLLERFLT